MIQKLKSSSDVSLPRLARVALWLGIAGFGGGFAIVQQLRRIVVQRYQWVTEEAFLDFFAVASALKSCTNERARNKSESAPVVK
jgi:hypothetical protein